MKYNDTVSTIVESPHSFTELLKFDHHLQTLIGNGGKLSEGEISTLLAVQQLLELSDNPRGAKLSTINSPAQNSQALTYLRRELKNVPVLEITAPFPADDQFVTIVTDNLVKMIKGPFVVKFSTDICLIAGCTLSFKGKFQDYSLKTKLVTDKGQVFKEIMSEIH